jgi:hypothetical protein
MSVPKASIVTETALRVDALIVVGSGNRHDLLVYADGLTAVRLKYHSLLDHVRIGEVCHYHRDAVIMWILQRQELAEAVGREAFRESVDVM